MVMERLNAAEQHFKEGMRLLAEARQLAQAKIEPTEAMLTDRERMAADLGLTPEQIAQNPDEVNDNTRAYLGSLVNYDDKHRIIPVFPRIGHLDQIYTDYPEAQIPVIDLTIGGVLKEKLPQLVKKKGNQISSYAGDMLRSRDFTTRAEAEQIRLFKAPIAALGFREVATTKEVYTRIDELGADLCPGEVGPYLRIQDTDQPMNDWYWIAMKQIADSYGNPGVFRLGRRGGGVWLYGTWASPGDRWIPEHQIVFSLRK